MKKFNADEQNQLSEGIEITIEGKVYQVAKITTDLMKQVTILGNTAEDYLDIMPKQLALLLNVEEKEFIGIDIRKLGQVLKFITDEIKRSIESINPSEAEAKN
jgi:translation elongation factor P/translation initiation factor 5A